MLDEFDIPRPPSTIESAQYLSEVAEGLAVFAHSAGFARAALFFRAAESEMRLVYGRLAMADHSETDVA